MNSRLNMDTGADSNHPRHFPSDCSDPHRQGPHSSSSRAARGQMSHLDRARFEQTQSLRLPQIQLPPFEANLTRHQNFTRLSTCPSLHQHQRGKESDASTQTILRKFFARPDDTSSYLESRAQTTSTTERFRDGVPHFSDQPPTLGNHSRQSSLSHSQKSSHPSTDYMFSYERTSSGSQENSRTCASYAATSNRADNLIQAEDAYWENAPSAGSSMTPSAGLLENSTGTSGFEEGGAEQGELYRCRDCNRKCKSKASYLKHRSMMCTHRLGPLTLECRYCKRHYTYAGYLQRHELECAKTHNS